MPGCCLAGHWAGVAMISEGHDVLLFMFLPLKEGFIGRLDVKARIIRL